LTKQIAVIEVDTIGDRAKDRQAFERQLAQFVNNGWVMIGYSVSVIEQYVLHRSAIMEKDDSVKLTRDITVDTVNQTNKKGAPAKGASRFA
jgi:hypothetical protein